MLKLLKTSVVSLAFVFYLDNGTFKTGKTLFCYLNTLGLFALVMFFQLGVHILC